MSESFLPPVTVEFKALDTGFLKTVTNLVANLNRLATAAKSAGESTTAAAEAVAASSSSFEAATAASAAAKKEMQGFARASRSVSTAAEKAGTVTDAAMSSIAASTERMAASVDLAAKAAGDGIAGVGLRAKETAAGLKVTTAESVAAGDALAASGVKADAFGGKLLGLGPVMDKVAKFGAIGIAGLGIVSVKMAMGFDQAMEMVHTQAGASQTEVDALKGKVLDLGPAVGMGPDALATGLYHIESAGFRSAQAMDILTAAAKLATIGQSDFETTSQAVVGVVASQIKGVKDAADAGNLLNTTVGMGDMKMQQLALAIGTGILPKAAAAGLSFEDVGAALATLTDNVTPANEAATRLGMTFSLMSASTPKAKKAFEDIGMTSNQLANDLRSKGLLGALEDLKSHLDAAYPPGHALKLSLHEQSLELAQYSKSLTDSGVPVEEQTTLLAKYKDQLGKSGDAAVKQSEALSAMFGGGKSSGTMMTLLGEMDRFKDKTAQYGTVASRAAQAQEAWKAQQAQFSQQIAEIRAQFDKWMTILGEKVIPYLQKFLGWVRDGVHWLEQHKVVLYVLAGVLAGVLVSALWSAVTATVAWTAALDVNPIFLVITAIAGLVGGLIYAYQHFKSFRDVVDAVGRFFKQAWKDAVEVAHKVIVWFGATVLPWLKDRLHELEAWWKDHGAQVMQIAKSMWTALYIIIKVAWALIWGYLSTSWKILADLWKFIWDVIKGTVIIVWTLIKDIIVGAWHGLLNIFGVFMDLLTGKWGQLWTDAKHLVTQGWKDVTGIFSDFASNAWKWLWQAGKDLIGGLVKGIEDTVGGVQKTLSDLTNSITSWKGPPERDAVLLHGSGQLIMKGLIAGIVSQKSALRAELGAVTGMIGAGVPSALSTSLSVASVAGMAGDPTSGLALRLGRPSLALGGAPSAQYGTPMGVPLGVTGGAPVTIVNITNNIAGSMITEKQVTDNVRTQVLQYTLRNTHNGLTLAGR